MDTEEILRLSKDGVDELKAAIEACGGEMSQHQFDKRFDESRSPLRLPGWILRSGVMWGDMTGSTWSCWLDLLKFMAENGLVSVEKRDGAIYYRLSPQPPADHPPKP